MALTHWASEGDTNTHLDKGHWTGEGEGGGVGRRQWRRRRRECSGDDVLQVGR